MKHSKLASFTLIEMVLAMMLAAIVIGMAYTAFTVFTHLYGNYRNKNLQHADVQLFRQILQHDMERAELVTISEGEIRFAGLDNAEQVVYRLSADYLLRQKGEISDTLKLKQLSCIASFENRLVSTGLVDHLVFRFNYQQSLLPVSSAKKYTSVQLFNYQDSLWMQ